MLAGKNILIIAPHPDDESICCGGLIMLAKKEKASVHVLFMAIGYSRQFLTGKTNATERIAELKKAAKYGNFTHELAFKGKAFMRMDAMPQKELIENIENTTQKYKPDIICIPSRESFDQDHRAVAEACITSFRPLPKSLRHQAKMILETEEPYSWGKKISFVPNFYFDISDIFDEKITLLKCHASQLRTDPFPRSPENLRRLAGLRGSEISTTYAEAYSVLRGQLL